MAKTTIHFAKVFAAHIESLPGCLTACLRVTRFVTPVGCASIQLCAAAAVGRVRRMLASSHEMNAQRQDLKYQLVCLCRAISKRLAVKNKKKGCCCKLVNNSAWMLDKCSELHDKIRHQSILLFILPMCLNGREEIGSACIKCERQAVYRLSLSLVVPNGHLPDGHIKMHSTD